MRNRDTQCEQQLVFEAGRLVTRKCLVKQKTVNAEEAKRSNSYAEFDFEQKRIVKRVMPAGAGGGDRFSELYCLLPIVQSFT